MCVSAGGGPWRAAPCIRLLSRREVLGLAVGIGGGLGLAGCAISRRPTDRADVQEAGAHAWKRVDLAQHPGQNPAYTAVPVTGGLLLYVLRSGSPPLAFLLNASAREIWRLCDGRTSDADVAKAYAQRSGRAAEEARRFLADLLERRLVLRGGYVRAPLNYPDGGGRPARYQRRLRLEDPVIG